MNKFLSLKIFNKLKLSIFVDTSSSIRAIIISWIIPKLVKSLHILQRPSGYFLNESGTTNKMKRCLFYITVNTYIRTYLYVHIEHKNIQF